MINGGQLQGIKFTLDAGTGYTSLLPSHALSEPQENAPNYYASVSPPNKFQLWKFHANWNLPDNSTLSGPIEPPIANFAIAASVPQLGSNNLLDSLSFRPMMQLIYREFNQIELLWLNHTVGSNGIAGIRWYEIRHPEGSPTVFQQSTYQPDTNHRWMGSLAVDQDGNMALGYSMSSSSINPAIYYTGRLAGETPGTLPIAEFPLYQGTGSQTSVSRWGDYSAMAVDPTDDCTFWYTTEYYNTTGIDWQTHIGSFKFPSCGVPKAHIEGVIRNSVTNETVAGAPVLANSPAQSISIVADEDGRYKMSVLEDVYNLQAGPLSSGYPTLTSVAGITTTTGITTTQDITLVPAPYLEESRLVVDDAGPHGNNNGYPEPGEAGIRIWEEIINTGAITATNITAHLSSLTPGVEISATNTTYPDIGISQVVTNTTSFILSIDRLNTCGGELVFQKTITVSVPVTNNETVFSMDFTLNASVPLPREKILSNDVETGQDGWTTNGMPVSWDITDEDSHSPNHSWTDSPAGNYENNANTALITPILDLSKKRNIQISAWVKYALEPGYDYVYLDYSLDGGATWSSDTDALAVFNAYQESWHQITLDTPILDNQTEVMLRFRLVSDPGVTDDGFYVDDISVVYEPYACLYSDLPLSAYLPMIFNKQ